MSRHKHQFSKLGIEFKDGDIKAIVTGAEKYRELLGILIDQRIESLTKTIEGDFDKRNYGLVRAFRDGGIHHLNMLREIIKDA